MQLVRKIFPLGNSGRKSLIKWIPANVDDPASDLDATTWRTVTISTENSKSLHNLVQTVQFRLAS